jgi:hypothetical protein
VRGPKVVNPLLCISADTPIGLNCNGN